MKHQEKVHLREDPLFHFFEKALVFFQKYKREILWGVGGIALVVLIAVLVMYFQGSSVANENKLLARGLEIKNSSGWSVDEKIGQLKRIQTKSGVSSVVGLYLAQLYVEKGDYPNALDVLRKAPSGRIRIVNDQKRLLEAQVLQSEGKSKEAEDMLTILLSDSQTEVAKDFILFQLAKLQIQSGHKQEAVSTLQRLMADFPNSMFAMEARNLLDSLEES
jgi:predicted negative regulator of RcsB-dependent stress response